MVAAIRKFVVVSLLIAICYASYVYLSAPPIKWITFYSDGNFFDGEPIPIGAEVTAYDGTGLSCGKYIVEERGSYGELNCYIDDVKTETVDEGVTAGDRVTFQINRQPAEIMLQNNDATDSFNLPTDIRHGNRFEVRLTAKTPEEHSDPPLPIPEPITVILFGTGLAGLAGKYLLQRFP